MAYTNFPLSGAVDGRPVLVAAIADPGTTIHTAQASATLFDEIMLSASNIDTADRVLSLEIGSNSASDIVQMTIPFGETVQVPAIFLRNSLVLKAYAAVANKILLFGHVIREG